ncbi:uncharacterized protein BYT42DRAFT_585887 [Radiomyces spectabilis]|uniref:uncharacterized protein n=1 Tax=Radiomyces spectabilis TaxID=64574 RepID=UPI002220FC28|nr:uncharacterized protein BYT42DRAFT_585887 [Radiomyces spectabilis]KAI8368244.1 hypothetical protein BYT42DRAFT_585887 [Radiomyces spectabilis]
MSTLAAGVVATLLSVGASAATAIATRKVPFFRTRVVAFGACTMTLIEGLLMCAMVNKPFDNTYFTINAVASWMRYLSNLLAWMILFDSMLLNKQARTNHGKREPYTAILVACALGGLATANLIVERTNPDPFRSEVVAQLSLATLFTPWALVLLFFTAFFFRRHDIAQRIPFLVSGLLLSINPFYIFASVLVAVSQGSFNVYYVNVFRFICGTILRDVVLFIAAFYNHSWLISPNTEAMILSDGHSSPRAGSGEKIFSS